MDGFLRKKQAEISIIWPSTLFLWPSLCDKPLINICRRTKNSSRTTSLWNIIRSFIWINIPSKLIDTWQLLLFRIILLNCFVVFTRFHKYETVSKVMETTFDKSCMPVKSMQPSFFRQIKPNILQASEFEGDGSRAYTSHMKSTRKNNESENVNIYNCSWVFSCLS